MKTKIYPTDLIGVFMLTIFVFKSECFLVGMYKQKSFVGCLWDFENTPTKSLIIMATDLFPKNITELNEYKEKFKDRVDYSTHQRRKKYALINEFPCVKKA